MKTKKIIPFVIAPLFNSFSQSNAKLIVYKPGRVYGSLANYKVNVDNKEVATLKSKSL